MLSGNKELIWVFFVSYIFQFYSPLANHPGLFVFLFHPSSHPQFITYVFYIGLHFGSEDTGNISIVFGDLSRNSVFFRTEVKPKLYIMSYGLLSDFVVVVIVIVSVCFLYFPFYSANRVGLVFFFFVS